LMCLVSIEGLVKIARISTVMIPERRKNCPYHYTFMITELYWWQDLMLCLYQVIPGLLDIVKYCKIIVRYRQVLWGIARYEGSKKHIDNMSNV